MDDVGVGNDLVAPIALGEIQGGVGELDELRYAPWTMVEEARRADAGRHLDEQVLRADVERVVGDEAPDAVSHQLRLPDAGFRQGDYEALAGVTRDVVRGTQGDLQHPRNLAQHVMPLFDAVGVVDILEV